MKYLRILDEILDAMFSQLGGDLTMSKNWSNSKWNYQKFNVYVKIVNLSENSLLRAFC